MIEGVKVKKLRRHMDERGYVMEILRDDDELFLKFGQVYISVCLPGIVKAWHAHKKQYDNFCVLKGLAKIGLYDGREDSPTYKETDTFILGELNPILLQIPPGVWHGQMALGNEPSFLLNIPTEHYDRENPDELRVDPFDNDFNYQWQPKSK
ncbi:MAG: dTDP-4-dehydrorhamnose 3,5-epimerase family protein [candidate division WOR-3 bacterium]